MASFEFITTNEEETESQPKYSDEGWILFEVYHIYPKNQYEIEILDYDHDSSVFWLQEGMGISYWINHTIKVEQTGIYMMEGVHGYYYRGDWSYGEDDTEEWYFELLRYATDEEVKKSVVSLG